MANNRVTAHIDDKLRRHPKCRLDAHPKLVAGVWQVALDPFRGYANAIRDELPDAVAALDAFHVVRLAVQALDEVRRRTLRDTRAPWTQGRSL